MKGELKGVEASMDMRSSSMGDAGMFCHDLRWLVTSDNSTHHMRILFNGYGDPDAPDSDDNRYSHHHNYNGRWMFLDESEVGCSEELAAGIGEYITKEWERIKPYCPCIVVVSYSHELIKRLPLDANWINLDGLSREEYLNREVIPIDVEEFEKHAFKFFDTVRDREIANRKKNGENW